MTGKRVTIDELFERKREELIREANSPEGRARAERSHAKFLREEEARLAWEAANPRTPYELGAEAAANEEPREPPEGVDAEQWLAGYDDELPGEDDE